MIRNIFQALRSVLCSLDFYHSWNYYIDKVTLTSVKGDVVRDIPTRICKHCGRHQRFDMMPREITSDQRTYHYWPRYYVSDLYGK